MKSQAALGAIRSFSDGRTIIQANTYVLSDGLGAMKIKLRRMRVLGRVVLLWKGYWGRACSMRFTCAETWGKQPGQRLGGGTGLGEFKEQ